MLDFPGAAGVPGPATSGDIPATGGVGRWLKPIVSVSLYSFIFWFTDVGAIWRRIAGARVEYVAGAVLLYTAGQALSAWRWQWLTRPLGLVVWYAQLLSFYFIGMFFNLFLPTIIGGDAVKAWLLARQTGAVARSTVSVFMERNLGLLALLTIAIAAAAWAPPVEVLGVPILPLTMVLFAGFAAANIVLLHPGAYALADRLIAATPLARMRPRAASLYEAIAPYGAAPREIAWAVLLSFAFQGIVIGVVFLNARALHHDFPLSAVAVFVPLISLGGMLPVSVNGLGVREALYVLLFGRIGAAPELAIALALVYLAVTFVASLPGGILYALQGSRVRAAGPPR